MTPWRHIILAAPLLFVIGGVVSAHPHVWVVMRAEIVFASGGSVTGLRYIWAFDESLSASVRQEAGDTPLTPESLAPLAQVNIDALKQSEFFTRAWADGTEQKFRAPENYWLAFEEGVLTLHFTLPFESPLKLERLELAVYDPNYFTDIKLAEQAPVILVSAPEHCRLSLERQSWTQTVNRVLMICL